MIENPVYNDDFVKGSDLQQVVDAVNANEVFTDNMTIMGNKSEAGISLSVVDQYGGGGASSATSALPFQLSLTVINDVQYASVSTGSIITSSQNVVPTGLVDISSYSIGDTVRIYLKVANNWLNGVNPRNHPVLTIVEGEGLTNFYGNDSVFPASDMDNFFYQIGEVLVSDAGEGEKKYEITSQIAQENAVINEVLLNGFSLLRVLEGKASDIASDTNYSLTMNTGNVKLPDNSNIVIASTTESVAIAGIKNAFIKISATINADGFFESFLAVSEFSETPVSDDSTNIYFSIGGLNAGVLTQNQIGDFVSDGRVW